MQFLKKWIIPPGPLDLLSNVRSGRRSHSIIGFEESKILARNDQFRNMFVGRRCFVIGNGPSLNKQDLSPLANEITIVMNEFYMHPILQEWQPTFWCLADPPDNYSSQMTKIKEGMTRANPKAFFLPISMKKFNDQHQIFPQEKTYFLKTKGMPTKTDKLDLTKIIPGSYNTDHMATMLALALGCSPIYLLGLDYDKLCHRSKFPHFYDSDSPEKQDDLSKYPYLHRIEFALNKYRAHDVLRDIGLKHGQIIFNATPGSFLDVYPEAQYEKVVSQDQNDCTDIANLRNKYNVLLTPEELQLIVKSIREYPACKLLVFGLGNDTPFWLEFNRNGRTVFLEDNKQWFEKITKSYPEVEAYLINYQTKISQWKYLLDKPFELEMQLNDQISKIKWDVILVDAPRGDCMQDNIPGRMASIYMASKLIQRGGYVFVHDCDRIIEDVYADKYLVRENFITQVKSIEGAEILRQYKFS